MSDVTRILAALERGDPQAADQLLPFVYDELRRLSARKLAHERPGQTFQATDLVHEAFLRLVGPDDARVWDGRGHFFAAAAEAMRRILIENARRKLAARHGGGRARESIDPLVLAAPENCDPLVLLDLDDALDRLAEADPEAARLVELRYFTGLTLPQAAEVLGVSPRSADRLWAYARAFLFRALHPD
ncbi:ECF-type sigma factor [Planctomyces sp. SH-PL62]|uniref:ECF-type sigma factor n=1 Tax=Planctomyces sp. SH-PL62 TaxID=1636152 RepID=UPI00078DB325|nr:ECF-type sigma factor [Planctomyces sp. SH-PL62]AMV37863.1 ECF sigma factor [Planctomyces sp. SH-PL62]